MMVMAMMVGDDTVGGCGDGDGRSKNPIQRFCRNVPLKLYYSRVVISFPCVPAFATPSAGLLLL